MSTKKLLVAAGTFLVLGAALAVAQSQDQNKVQESSQAAVTAQAQTRTAAQNKAATGNEVATQTRTRAEARIRTRFVDQNGDGINDLYRDADNDGIPNCQDPDWTRPQDGTGYQARAGQGAVQNQLKGGKGAGFTNASFRSAAGPGTCCTGGICDGTGPKGKTLRKGRG